jgi:hypothetical protein
LYLGRLLLEPVQEVVQQEAEWGLVQQLLVEEEGLQAKAQVLAVSQAMAAMEPPQ